MPEGPKLTASPPLVKPAPVQTQLAYVNSYGWTNKEAGAAHIPVDRAMQIILSQGMPPLKELPATPVPSPAPGSNLPGAALFTQLGCVGCHGDANSPLAPTLHGLYGKPVKLADGQTANADDAYFKELILDPQAKVVEGYQPVMPSFKGRVTDEQINQLIDYIKSQGGS